METRHVEIKIRQTTEAAGANYAKTQQGDSFTRQCGPYLPFGNLLISDPECVAPFYGT